jgi:hypothetical protein
VRLVGGTVEFVDGHVIRLSCGHIGFDVAQATTFRLENIQRYSAAGQDHSVTSRSFLKDPKPIIVDASQAVVPRFYDKSRAIIVNSNPRSGKPRMYISRLVNCFSRAGRFDFVPEQGHEPVGYLRWVLERPVQIKLSLRRHWCGRKENCYQERNRLHESSGRTLLFTSGERNYSAAL